MSKPWLSVLMPIYNGEKFIASALESILLQYDNEIECIVVDGQSSDATLSILEEYQNKIPIQIFQYDKDSNWVDKTNFALSAARGEYVCFLHHDDFWFSERLGIMKLLTKQFPDVVMLMHPSCYFDDNGNNLGVWACPLPPIPKVIKTNQMIEKLLIQNFISIPAPVFKREVALNVKGMDERLWYTADWDFWLKIATWGDTIYHPYPLTGFRIHQNSQTIVRSSYSNDIRTQLEIVFKKNLDIWESTKSRKKTISKIGVFSIEVNVTLADLIHQKQSLIFKLFVDFLCLGPIGWHLYFVNSRIWERVTARLRANLITRHQKQ